MNTTTDLKARLAEPRLLLWPEAAVPDYLSIDAGARRRIARLLGPGDLILTGGVELVFGADGRAVAEAIKASGKQLTTIYVSQSDPDYYFSLGPIKAAFPAARVLAASDTIAAIRANVQKKIATWAPQLKENGPQKLADIVFPEAYDGPALMLEGNTIEIVKAQGLENRRYLWVPSLNAVFGGVLIFSGLHVWTADTPTATSRAAWVKNLEAIAARNPAVVVPGHLGAHGALDVSAVNYTREYLLAFEQELARAANGDALIAAMSKRYPDAGLAAALQIGAKVAMGEMKWG